jgi:hypothetical protein
MLSVIIIIIFIIIVILLLGIQPYVAHIWRGNKHVAPVMQTNGLIFSISYILSIAIYNSFFMSTNNLQAFVTASQSREFHCIS